MVERPLFIRAGAGGKEAGAGQNRTGSATLLRRKGTPCSVQVFQAWNDGHGEALATLVSFSDSHIANARLQVCPVVRLLVQEPKTVVECGVGTGTG